MYLEPSHRYNISLDKHPYTFLRQRHFCLASNPAQKAGAAAVVLSAAELQGGTGSAILGYELV